VFLIGAAQCGSFQIKEKHTVSAESDKSERTDNLDGRLTVSPREAAAAVGKGLKQLYADINSGKLPSAKDGKRRRIYVPALRAYAAQISGAQAAA
jgi:excisionase family DNA binding protein